MKFNENEIMECRRCGTVALPDIVKAPPPHDRKIVCPVCGFTHGFLAKEKNEKKLEHRPNGQPAAAQLMEIKQIDYCEICLRPKERLGRKGYFEVHHISKTPSDHSIGNLLLVCKACHQFIHYLQTYLNDHMNDKSGGEDVNIE